MYNIILTYIYSWFLIESISMHKYSHYIFAKILKVKILKVKIYKVKNTPLYNGVLITEIPNRKWKQLLITLSPLFLLSFTFISKYFLIYIILTTFYYKSHIINIILPSKMDIKNFGSP